MTKRPAAIALLLLAGCVSRPAPPPAAKPAPPPVPTLPGTGDWRDVPETAGAWAYRRDAAGSSALFGQAGAAPDFILRCDTATRSITLSRPGAAAAMAVTTSYATMRWPASPAGGRIVVTLRADDPFLDRIAFSRGRFTSEAPGLPTLVLPAWAEPARVIEDCRE